MSDDKNNNNNIKNNNSNEDDDIFTRWFDDEFFGSDDFPDGFIEGDFVEWIEDGLIAPVEHMGHVEEVTSMELPMDWENLYASDERAKGVHADSIPDALILSLTTLGCVDIEYMAEITGEGLKTVINALKGAIYQNPETWGECFYKGWETAEEYLSGNLVRKWNAANKANTEYNGYFEDNLRAIERILPPQVASKDIYVTLGSPWVPADVIDDFIVHLFGEYDPPHYFYYSRAYIERIREENRTKHDEASGTWEIPNKSRYYHSVSVTKTYGTNRIEALHILEDTLNMKTIKIMDEIECPENKNGRKMMPNRKETMAAVEKQRLMIKEFREWVWTDPDRKARLEKIFEEKYSCVVRRNYDGSFLTFPTMSPDVKLYPYQKDAVARMIFSPNTLLAHDVGAGKTYEMIAAGQELRRMGLSKKNMYVVPNNIIGQWKSIFLQMYPDAEIQCVDPAFFKPDNRRAILEMIRDYDYDGIIIAYSCFDMIPLSKDYYLTELRRQRKEIKDRIAQKEKNTVRLRAKEKRLTKEILDLSNAPEGKNNGVFFEELGITRLFVDEAHNYKNVPVDTRADCVFGISRNGSSKCETMMEKVHLIQRLNGGGGVVMATGTPITNSITDLFVMQKYLQSGELAMLDLQTFDSWVGMFAESETQFEVDVDTTNYRLVTRFAKFHNLPELTALLAAVADFHSVEDSEDIPHHDGYIDTQIERTPEFDRFLKSISERADAVRSGKVKRDKDNMLKITVEGRLAALDIRLVMDTAPFSSQLKVAKCAENVADIYFKTFGSKSTQLVFCDASVPKAGFNLYDELKSRLVSFYGIPEEKIAYIHDAKTEKNRNALFRKVQNGEIRILIGSTFKLGLGVNVQNRLIAVHHLDVPWRPADMTQREGRILRQGNMNSEVYIYRYITEGSFDAYSWQLLETKQRFISSLLSGSLTDRSGSDVDDTVLDYAEVKAIAIGNPLVKERVEAANEMARYMTLQNKLTEIRLQMEKELLELPARIDRQNELIRMCEDDTAFVFTLLESEEEEEERKAAMRASRKGRKKSDSEDLTIKEEAEARKELRETIFSAVMANSMKPADTVLMSYRGFDIVLPRNMTVDRPYIWLVRTGRYCVELGENDVGNLQRIDNYISKMADHLADLRSALKMIMARKSDIETELAKCENYTDKIEFYKRRVEEIDEELGVNDDE
ncbi:Helicase conserved C-terminal domain-containing protein [Ruminococcaceae bacterium YRB3002]|nr:Helicase conserved C-terminal domain-containing protein [Ruminococcaceae bacterium YRB3002]